MRNHKPITTLLRPFGWAFLFLLPLHSVGQERSRVDELSRWIANDTNNVVLLCLRAKEWHRLEKDRKALKDINKALKKIDRQISPCDLSQYGSAKIDKGQTCTAHVVALLYEDRALIYHNRRKFDKAAADLEKAVSYLPNDMLVDDGDEHAVSIEINDIYTRMGIDYKFAERYGDALSCYSRAIASLSYSDIAARPFYILRSKVEIILGKYIEAAADLDKAGFHCIPCGPSKDTIDYPEVFDYLTILIAQRKFDGIDGALRLYCRSALDADGRQRVTFFGQFMDRNGEKCKRCRRVKSDDVVYSFFNYYQRVSQSMARKDYAGTIKYVDRQMRKVSGKLFFPYRGLPAREIKAPYLLASHFYSLKGYLLAKQDSLNDAMDAYNRAVEIDSTCSEAKSERGEVQARIDTIRKIKEDQERRKEQRQEGNDTLPKREHVIAIPPNKRHH